MIPWSAAIRTAFIQFILEDALALSLFGFGFILIGLAMVTHILQNSKRRYYYVRSDQSVLVNETALEEYVNAYWKQLFPGRDIPSRLTLKKNKIQITAALPDLPFDQQKQLMEKIKNDLDDHFKQLLGPQSEFSLMASFPPRKSEKALK